MARRPNPIPARVREDDKASRRFRVKVAEALARRLDVSDWQKIALEHDLEDEITEHPRFLRSAQWQDPDYEGLVLDLVEHLYTRDPALFVELVERENVQAWLRWNAGDLLDLWEGVDDPLLTALTHSASELQEADEIDLEDYRRRIEAALPDDPAQAVGATKDMLEAAMRTILDSRGEEGVDGLDFPALATRCFHELGLSSTHAPKTAEERSVRKLASAARSMIDAANEIRNAAGTGHGRVTSRKALLTEDDARFVAASGFLLTAWLLRRSQV